MRSIDYTQHQFSNDYSTEDDIYDTEDMEDTLGLSDSKVPRSAFVQSDERFYGLVYLQNWTKTEVGVFVLLIITIVRAIFTIIKGRYIFLQNLSLNNNI